MNIHTEHIKEIFIDWNALLELTKEKAKREGEDQEAIIKGTSQPITPESRVIVCHIQVFSYITKFV